MPAGQRADKLLLTNLYNYTQPIIRYEVTAQIILHREPCPCGNPSPWLEIEGRNDDVLTLERDGKPVRIPPLAIYAELKEVHELKRFQLLKHRGNTVELRLEPRADTDRSKAFEAACGALKKRFRLYGVEDVAVVLSEELPRPHPRSGKFKHIINLESAP